MAATTHPVATAEDRRALVEGILASDRFGRSRRLLAFLRCITDADLAGQAELITEQFIGQNVYGKPPGYNAAEENIVRVDARRLRAALHAYFTAEGAGQPWILEIPKGHYAPVYRRRAGLPAQRPALSVAEDVVQDEALTSALRTAPQGGSSESTDEGRPKRDVRFGWLGIAAATALGCFAIGYLLGSGARMDGGADVDAEVARFWGNLTNVPGGVRVVYSNSPNPVTPYGRVLDKSDPDAVGDDGHTGVGEVQAVHSLAGVFHRLGLRFDLKRALLVHWDEVLDVNVVYLGGPASNPQVAELGASADFVFDQVPLEQGAQYVIRNRNPIEDESEVLASNDPLTTDYGLIRLTPGFRSDRWILLLAGITTFGTAAAAEVVSDPASLSQIRSSLDQDLRDPVTPFECVVEVGIKNNVPFENRVKSCRALSVQQAAAR